MESEQSSDAAAIAKHKKFLFINGKKRFIEVFQCSGEDMNLVLTHGLLPNGGSVSSGSSMTNGHLNGIQSGMSTNISTGHSSQLAPLQPAINPVPTMSLIAPSGTIPTGSVLGQKPLISPGNDAMMRLLLYKLK